MKNWRDSYRKAVTFSYDDGVEQDLKLLEIFNKYGMKATFNLNSSLTSGDADTWVYKDKLVVRRMDLADHVEDYRGHEIAVHTQTHPDLTKLDDEELHRQIFEDRDRLAQIFGYVPLGGAYPFGTWNEHVIEELDRAGLKYFRTVRPTYSFAEQKKLLAFDPTCHHDDERIFDLIDQFLEMDPEEPAIFYIWGHAYEFEGNGNWDRIERICERLAGKSDIFYGTNREVLL